MARGDGKAQKGRTKGSAIGVKRMATGGFAASSREGGFAGAGAGRLESPGQRSSVSPGGGNVSAGNTPGGGGGGRDDFRSPVSNAARNDYLSNPARSGARLGPNAAQAMANAGVNPDVATLAAKSINRLSPSVTPSAPAKSPMAVYGNEFSFTPEEKTSALKSMYNAKLPGAGYTQLMGLKKAMQDPKNKAMASTLAAPFSNRTRAPVKSIADRVTQDPAYSAKDQDRLLSGPVEAPVYSPPRAPATRGLSQLANYTGQEQRFRPAPVAPAPTAPKAPAAPAAGSPPKATGGTGSNFTAGQFPRERRGDDDRPRRRKKKPITAPEGGKKYSDGGRINGAAVRGWTKGKMV